MPIILLLLAGALAANVLLGPLGFGVIQWRVSANALNQTYGADGASLLLVVPATLAAAWLWRAHNRLASPLALGIGLATLYYAIAEVLGADYVRYSGNNERFFLLFLSLIILSWVTAARAWSALDDSSPTPSPWLRRALGVVMLLGGGLIGVAWTTQLVPIALTGNVGPDYLDSPSAFWTIRIVDLGFIVPLTMWTGVGLWNATRSAIKAAYGLASFLTFQSAAVLTMGIVMLWRQDPTASAGLIYALAPITGALAVLTVVLLRSYAVVLSRNVLQPEW